MVSCDRCGAVWVDFQPRRSAAFCCVGPRLGRGMAVWTGINGPGLLVATGELQP